MKKWVVEIEKESGRVETRLVPARNKCTAISNCKNEGDTVLSCVPYTGQNVKVAGSATKKRNAATVAILSVMASDTGQEERGENMAAAVMSIDKQKARADEALELVGQLDTSMQKAVYIATKMFLAAKETPEEKGKPKK